MLESIHAIRQKMAEAKFSEALRDVEKLLALDDSSLRLDLLQLYLEIHLKQSRPLPSMALLEVTEALVAKDPAQADLWIKHFDSRSLSKNFRRYMHVKIKCAEHKGAPAELYQLLSDYHIFLYERGLVDVPPELDKLMLKFFPKDFKLNLQRLALSLISGDRSSSEERILSMLREITESSSLKGVREKHKALAQVLTQKLELGVLAIYRNFCLISSEGISDRRELKKVAEMVIYFDDLHLQLLVLKLLHDHELEDQAHAYALAISQSNGFSRVYVEKYFPEQKKFFAQTKSQAPALVRATEEVTDFSSHAEDVKIENQSEQPEMSRDLEDEALLNHFLVHNSYTAQELQELAVSFLQSSLPGVALKASTLAAERATSEREQLKATYLILTCLLQLGDYRAALDVAIQGLEKSQTRDDLLSFLYGQADALIKLNLKSEAQVILRKIMSIDPEYRLTKERLGRLNEV